VPVIITEFSAVDKKNEQQRTAWARYIRQQAEKLGIAYIWWDAGPGEEEGKPFPLYNRYTRKWLFPDLKEALTQ
jgi:alpha-glucosidase (family GH31 glycosyl hydrolase)